jgi:hypothetical protein
VRPLNLLAKNFHFTKYKTALSKYKVFKQNTTNVPISVPSSRITVSLHYYCFFFVSIRLFFCSSKPDNRFDNNIKLFIYFSEDLRKNDL